MVWKDVYGMSKWLLPGMGLLVVGAIVAIGVVKSQPEYDIGELDGLLAIFERQAEPIRKGLPGYSLPRPAQAARELAYLEALTGLLEGHTGDCAATEKALLAQHRAYLDQPGQSIFRDAHRVWEQRRGQDFVHDWSDQVSLGRTPGVRPTTPTDPNKRMEVLQRRFARVELVEGAARALRRLMAAGRRFSSDCALESTSLRTVLGTLGN
jgi:hypothetical protein